MSSSLKVHMSLLSRLGNSGDDDIDTRTEIAKACLVKCLDLAGMRDVLSHRWEIEGVVCPWSFNIIDKVKVLLVPSGSLH